MKELLNSPRFYGVILTAASAVLIDPAFGTQAWYIPLAKFIGLVSAGVVTIRTVDRSADLKSTATTVTMPSTVSTVTATQEQSA